MKLIATFLLAALCAIPTFAASYPNGGFAYSAPPLAALPSAPPSGNYVPATFDDKGIQAAINAAAAAGGGTVTLKSGTYTINNEVYLKSNLLLTGAGIGNSIMQRGSGFVYQTGTISPTWVGLLASRNSAIHDVKVSAITIDGAIPPAQLASEYDGFLGVQVESDSTASNHNLRIQLSAVEVKGCGQGVSMKGTTEITLWNGSYHDNGGGGYFHNIYFRRAGDISIKGINSYNSGAHGLKIAGGTSFYPNESKNITVQNSTIQNNGYLDMYITGVSNMRVYNTTLDYGANLQNSSVSGGGGILIDQESGVGSDTIDLVNNLVQYNYAYGFRIYSTNNLNIQGNRCNTNSTANYEVHATNMTCDYNTL